MPVHAPVQTPYAGIRLRILIPAGVKPRRWSAGPWSVVSWSRGLSPPPILNFLPPSKFQLSSFNFVRLPPHNAAMKRVKILLAVVGAALTSLKVKTSAKK